MIKEKFRIQHWGANMPPINPRWGKPTREHHFRNALLALILALGIIAAAAYAINETAERARKEARP